MSYLKAILSLRPGSQVAIIGNDVYANIDWNGEDQIQQATLDAELIRLSELPPPAPTKVSMYQARTALSRAGLLATVEAALASMPGQGGEEARIKWEYATAVNRDDALVTAMAGILSLESAGMDNLFITASEII